MPNQPLSIGVLLPRSQIYPSMGANFLAGLRLALPGCDLAVEDYGFGQIMAEEKSKKLLLWHGADLIVGLVSVNVAATLQPIVAAQHRLFLAANIGENIPRDSEQHPLFFQHTLGLWQANWALGRWAAAQLGRTAIVSQSHYDSGYDLPFAFRQGFESGGGTIQTVYISHIPPDTGNFAPLFERAAAIAPDLLFGSYCGPTAAQFVRAYADSGLARRIPLLGSGMLTDAALLGDLGAAALSIRSARAWPDTLAGTSGEAFAAAYAAQQQGQPDGFALLGYEAGLLAAQAMRIAGDSAGRPAALHAALAAAAVDGPRGRLAFDQQTQATSPASIQLREVRGQGEWLVNSPIAELEPPRPDEPDLAEIRRGLRSGWLNTYLSV